MINEAIVYMYLFDPYHISPSYSIQSYTHTESLILHVNDSACILQYAGVLSKLKCNCIDFYR
jgi:hypothetical protein